MVDSRFRSAIQYNVGPHHSPTESILLVGLAIRLTVGMYATTSATFENIVSLDYPFVVGLNPLSAIVGYGPGFYLSYFPAYGLFSLLNQMGIHSGAVLNFLFKLPPIAGDVITWWTLRNIVFQLTGDARKSATVAALFFLNPFPIYTSAVTGHQDSIMIGLLLLSFWRALRQDPVGSSLWLALSSTFRFLPALMAPALFLMFWRSVSPSSAYRFLKWLILFGVVVLIPYMLISFTLLQVDPAGFLGFLQLFGGPVGAQVTTYGFIPLASYRLNFTGYLMILGAWPELSRFFGLPAFLIVFIVINLWLISRTYSFRHILSYALMLFVSFMLLIPLHQPHYLMWIFSMLIVSSTVYSLIPNYFVNALWISNMAVWPIIDPGFSTFFNETYPSIFGNGQTYVIWLESGLRNVLFEQSISFMYGILLLNVVVFCAAGLHRNQETKRSPLAWSKSLSVVSALLLVVALIASLYGGNVVGFNPPVGTHLALSVIPLVAFAGLKWRLRLTKTFRPTVTVANVFVALRVVCLAVIAYVNFALGPRAFTYTFVDINYTYTFGVPSPIVLSVFLIVCAIIELVSLKDGNAETVAIRQIAQYLAGICAAYIVLISINPMLSIAFFGYLVAGTYLTLRLDSSHVLGTSGGSGL